MTENPALNALGLMSGTSLDGIDAALLRTDGERIFDVGPAITVPYSDQERDILERGVAAAVAIVGCRPGPSDMPEDVKAAEQLVTTAHARVAEQLIRTVPKGAWSVDVVGFHGQTVVHRPEEGWTWQIGDGEALAQRLGLPVVDDFRSADVTAGGEGAPFAPLYHRALVQSMTRREVGPVAVLNIGGVANVTWVGEDGPLIAFDTGPGNGLLDDWMLARSGQKMDLDGATASHGKVDDAVLAQLLDHPYFNKPAPKSLDRHDFGLELLSDLSPEDGAATLTAFTAQSIARACALFDQPPRRWLVGGGGRHNPVLMKELSAALGMTAEAVEAVGWRGDAMEAEAFGFLAVAALRNLPLSFPSTTGVPQPLTGGRVHQLTNQTL